MNANEMMKNEAIHRIRMLELHSSVEENFNKGVLQVSYNGRISLGGHIMTMATLYDLSDDYKKMVADFEEEYGFLVYHLITTPTGVGTLLSFLYVTNDQDCWDTDHRDLEEGFPFVYVANLDNESFSEFGRIGVRECHGGLLRTQ